KGAKTRGHDHGAHISSKRRVASASRNNGDLVADLPRFARAPTAVAAALYRRAGWQHGERLDIARRLQPRVGSAALTCFSTSQLRHIKYRGSATSAPSQAEMWPRQSASDQPDAKWRC